MVSLVYKPKTKKVGIEGSGVEGQPQPRSDKEKRRKLALFNAAHLESHRMTNEGRRAASFKITWIVQWVLCCPELHSQNLWFCCLPAVCLFFCNE